MLRYCLCAIAFASALSTGAASQDRQVCPDRAQPLGAGSRSLEGKVIGGEPAQPGEFPFQVALLISANVKPNAAQTERFLCSGTILNSRHILTAAHCLHSPDRNAPVLFTKQMLTIKTGSRLSDSATSDSEADSYPVETCWIHGSYASGTGANDIAIVKLATALPADVTAKAVTLANANDEARDIRKGSSFWIAGWGQTSLGAEFASEELMKGVVEVTDQRACADAYRQLPNPITVTDRMFCAIGRNVEGQTVDTCGGDSGGYIGSRADDRYVQFGLTSFGKDRRTCANRTYPGVYTRIAPYRDWIRARTGP